MRFGYFATCLMLLGLGFADSARAQAPRLDAIWARTTDGAAITLDGVLDEPAWAMAESVFIKYGIDTGIPGSGWQEEGGFFATDSTRATIRLLVEGNKLYLGAVIPDSSVGGSEDFNRFDGLLMAIKDHSVLDRPAPPAEYFYSWWYPEDPNHNEINKEPGFIGKWGVFPPTDPRDPEAIANWDAVTIVDGVSNSDTLFDVGYTIEMCFNLTPMGYDVTDSDGDIVEWNISIYDADWVWPLNAFRFSSNRTWWQGPWGNSAFYNEVRVYSRPDVTVNSGPVPVIEPEVRVPSAGGLAAPVIDGELTEPVWENAPGIDIRYGDTVLRDSYPGVAAFRSGQFQPEVNGGLAPVFDPGDATVKWFHKDDSIYFGFDVRDEAVQFIDAFDRWDGFIVSINHRDTLTADNNLVPLRLSFQVDENGEARAHDYLPFLRDTLFGAEVQVSLKPNTTVDTTGTDVDEGYTAELKVDLTKIGYPSGLGDRSVFFGITLLDGDSFTPFTFSSGTRTWWFREFEGSCCPVWGYLDPVYVVGVDDPGAFSTPGYALLGSFPNPFRSDTVIRYRLAQRSDVQLDLYDVQGRLVRRQSIGSQSAGENQIAFRRGELNTGLYFYRLSMTEPGGNHSLAKLSGKMIILE